MRIAYTDAALADLDEILEYITLNYPSSVAPFEERLNLVLARLVNFPKAPSQWRGAGKSEQLCSIAIRTKSSIE